MGFIEEPSSTATGQPWITESHLAQSIAQDAFTDEQTLLDLDSLNVSALKDRLRNRGLAVSGRKAVLVARLRSYLTQTPYEEPPAPVAKAKRKKMEDEDYDYLEAVCAEKEDYPPPAKKLAAAAPEPNQGGQVIIERRCKPWRHHASKDTLARLDRALKQRLFLVDRTRTELSEEFKIFGSTGSIYTVTIDQTPRCTCPDGGVKRNICKHLIFCWIRVLGVDANNSALWYQAALLKSELADVFNNAKPAPNDPQAEKIRAAYKKAVGDTGEEESEQQGGNKRALEDDADCSVCYESLVDKKEALWYCTEGCGNALHRQCFNEWKNAARTRGHALSCPNCRKEIGDAPVQRPQGGQHINGYLNLAEEVGIGRVRDTSTYYHGPRRGISNRDARALEWGYAYGDY